MSGDLPADAAVDLVLRGLFADLVEDPPLVIGPAETVVPAALQARGARLVPADDLAAVDARPPLIWVSAVVDRAVLAATLAELMSGPLTDRAVLLVDGAGEPDRRAIVDGVHLDAWSKVAAIDLDLVPARVRTDPDGRYALHGGLGFVACDVEQAPHANDPRTTTWYPTVHVLRRGANMLATLDNGDPSLPAVRDDLTEEQLHALRMEVHPTQLRTESELRALERVHQQLYAQYLTVVNSSSWKLTAPLRALMARIAGRGS